MKGFKSEKEQAFEQQALAHTDLLRRFGMRLTGNAADADDLVQETYLKAYRFWDSYELGTNVRAWLFRILKNSFINLYRKQSKAPEMVEYGDMMRLAPEFHGGTDENDLQKLLLNRLLDDDVSSAISGLPEEFRTIVILCDIEGLTYQEIAHFVACPVGTVRSRLHRGRKLLHSQLYNYAKERGYATAVESSLEGLQFVL